MRVDPGVGRGAALFDLDHTLISKNASFLFGRFLYQTKVISLKNVLFLVGCYTQHKCFNGSLSLLHQRSFDKLFKGKLKSDILKSVDSFLDQYLSKMLFLPVVERLNQAKQNGDYTAILSNSPDFLVESIALRLNVDHHLGTRYVTDRKGIFVAVTDFVTGREKADYTACLLEKGISLKETTAYSDSQLDIPFLEAVARPVAVRPDRSLRKLSQRERWEIIN